MTKTDTASLKGWRTVLKPLAPEPAGHDFVTGNWPPEGHPLYSDDDVVGHVTDWLIERNRTVFQLYLLSPYESLHSLEVLQRVNVPANARVLSLGCGIAGMESYWHIHRPDLHFTLVNASRAQLERSLCPGERVLCDMRSPLAALPGRLGWYDLVVMGYSLHHADDVPAMLRIARSMLRPGGTLLVLDMADCSMRFDAMMRYRSLQSHELQHAGLVRIAHHGEEWHRMPVEVIGPAVDEMLDGELGGPGMWLGGA